MWGHVAYDHPIMGGLVTPEITENNMILNSYSFLVKCTILFAVTDVQNWRDGRTLPNFSSHDHFKTDKTKGKYIISTVFHVKDKQRKGTLVHHP